MTRYEVKLVGDARDHRRVLSELRLLPAVLRPHHPPRTVQSIYLDTPNGRALADNLAGISNRTKVRVRWYGEATDLVNAHLEQKHRSNALGTKDVVRLGSELRVRGVDRRAFVANLRTRLEPAAAEWLHGLEPAQWIRYRREYFVSRGKELRVTVDRDVTAFDQRVLSTLDCRHGTPIPKLLIVELKAAAEHREAIEEWLQHTGLRPSKCSKFVLASIPGEAPIASRYC
ncbi:MAG: polyphosphate polymerase domain-containing protein [bacterium]|nr:polyphosphate polymerase domain-containing protein [bacterium]